MLVGRGGVTVAAVGDSRCIAGSRAAGVAALSVDHKGGDPHELRRVLRAGCWVSSSGRVCGELDMSRALGDADLKQAPGLPQHLQAVTADPTVTHMALRPHAGAPEAGTEEAMTAAAGGPGAGAEAEAAASHPAEAAAAMDAGAASPAQAGAHAGGAEGLPADTGGGQPGGRQPRGGGYGGCTYVLLASDGLWNVMDNRQVHEFVVERLEARLPAEVICAQLVVEACVSERTAYDNVSVLMVLLHGVRPEEAGAVVGAGEVAAARFGEAVAAGFGEAAAAAADGAAVYGSEAEAVVDGGERAKGVAEEKTGACVGEVAGLVAAQEMGQGHDDETGMRVTEAQRRQEACGAAALTAPVPVTAAAAAGRAAPPAALVPSLASDAAAPDPVVPPALPCCDEGGSGGAGDGSVRSGAEERWQLERQAWQQRPQQGRQQQQRECEQLRAVSGKCGIDAECHLFVGGSAKGVGEAGIGGGREGEAALAAGGGADGGGEGFAGRPQPAVGEGFVAGLVERLLEASPVHEGATMA
ncbi:putative protein phosphatase 2C 21 [Tetrabaena socialis]|uniref:PPM-type phosphatase domain-containing protein n=1 Tax=Tetrabaena socialis TaxID=47790 RepID=A0A2J7ZXB4_9CHLO|nr:putative protein phosphatase 2C 21 [Tetrabaena socialis]|eukprot:PNH04921.1 putative protein phosphatase 2C 21 [Tetrabaena socialis]